MEKKMALELSELCGKLGILGGKNSRGAEAIQQLRCIVTQGVSKTHAEVVTSFAPAIHGGIGRQ